MRSDSKKFNGNASLQKQPQKQPQQQRKEIKQEITYSFHYSQEEFARDPSELITIPSLDGVES